VFARQGRAFCLGESCVFADKAFKGIRAESRATFRLEEEIVAFNPGLGDPRTKFPHRRLGEGRASFLAPFALTP
jgi:hypothetical protein